MNSKPATAQHNSPAKASFTPGPWTCGAVVSDHPFDICLGYEVKGEGSPIMLASVFSDEGANAFISVDQAKANARLIASAPALLEALIAYVELEESAAPYSASPIRLKARAAINAATSAPA